MKEKIYKKLLDFINNLEKHKIPYTLLSSIYNAIMVTINFPGEIWEIEFIHDDEATELAIEKYISDGAVLDDESLLDEAIKRWLD
jgi:hypothetical protein